MRRILLIACITLATIVLPDGVKADNQHPTGHSHGNQAEKPHQHSKREISAGQPVPKVDLEVLPDPMGGWNLQVKVANFKFAPERVNQAGNLTEGHAHLYVNGKKITRLYGNWYYLAELTPGPQSVTVTLNTNAHEELFYQGKRIEATKRLIVFPSNFGK